VIDFDNAGRREVGDDVAWFYWVIVEVQYRL